ncbi:MFS transporter [Nocardia tengchongensis]|uniref:MFS transporter n=1 Tax=Nocardia tengchongensis TaxID=2055889 RepID=UPI0033F2D012
MSPRAPAVAVAAAYGAQGLGYATVVTVLPEFKARLGIGEMTISLLLLGTCVAAAAGSVLADLLAVRWGSRQALCAGLVMEALALGAVTVVTDFGPFLAAFVLYGVGLGTVDAASNMQGVLVQQRVGASLLGRLYAAYTAAAILGALLVSGCLAGGSAMLPLLVTVFVLITLAVTGIRRFDPSRAAHRARDDAATREPLPWPGIWRVGALVLAAFTIDAAISTWSTVYLADGLRVTAATAPLGYAAYQAAVLAARVAVDSGVRRFGRAPVTLSAIVAGLLGCATVAVVPNLPGAIAGFAAAGLCAGALVPIAFSAAGELRPDRGDEVIARVNLFNYAGVVVGAVTLGLIATGPALGVAFALPAVVLLAVVPLVARGNGARATEFESV